MPKDAWKNSRTRPNLINQIEHARDNERDALKAERKAYYSSIKNPAYWAAVRRNKQLQQAKWADAMKRMSQSHSPGITVDALSGHQSGLDDAGGGSERSERRSGATEASRTPGQFDDSFHPAGAHAPVGDYQLTLFT